MATKAAGKELGKGEGQWVEMETGRTIRHNNLLRCENQVNGK